MFLLPQFGAANQSGAGDHSNGGGGPDLTLSTGPTRPRGIFTPPISQLRGGFRYLNVFLEAGGQSGRRLRHPPLLSCIPPVTKQPCANN